MLLEEKKYLSLLLHAIDHDDHKHKLLKNIILVSKGRDVNE